ncbi:MAG: GTP-binding protein [Bacteroidia bacterium]|jgi:GTP-binding protein
MDYPQAEFVMSNTDSAKCPKPEKPEYAFIGRSNVGKSSLINKLFNKKSLAKTSGKPGKTQLINHFLVDKKWYLVDLPGYGYASVSKSDRVKWDKMIRNYMLTRENLVNVYVLVDLRVPPQKLDLDFLEWLGMSGLAITILYTKADKLTKVATVKQLELYEKTLLETWEELPPFIVTSAQTGRGTEAVLDQMRKYNGAFSK